LNFEPGTKPTKEAYVHVDPAPERGHRISDQRANFFPHLMGVSEVIPNSIHWKDNAKTWLKKNK